ncbi:MAG TPA: sigma-70 family RNA polymerase sigma factor [Candidatus Limnocylindria bacterium]|nr:sigma-70 family RNA polymerase sigma factor [Candidatus Limnocylindria bacterium]
MADRALVDERLAGVLRDERGRLTAALVRILGDWDVAEELVQDAAIAALEHWTTDGIPDNPGAWLMTAARRKAVDRLRRHARYRERMEQLTREASEMAARIDTAGPMGADDRLRLLFTCCHPALNREAQIALTLRTIGGLQTAEVARAFLVPEATIAQRLVRAKRKIRDAGIPYRVPDPSELPARLAEVLTVLYLVFNEGYLASAGDRPERRELARDAEWLTSLVARLMPDEPEVLGLLALMRLHLARADARFAPDGSLVLLPDQDRGRWDHDAIADAVALLSRAERMNRPAGYQLQAAILAAHAGAATWAETPWAAIVALYDALLRLEPTPVVALNRALAVAELDGASAGLQALAPLAERLDGYHLFHAARAEMLRRLGRSDEARAADQRALSLTDNPAERRLLEERLSG